jgi:predicted PurR-regulated permease PerM
MTNESPAAGLSRLAIVFFIACFGFVVYFLYEVFLPFFSILIWAVVLTVIFSPLFTIILRRLRGRRAAAAFLTCLLILLLIVLPLTFLGVLITQQSIALYESAQQNAGSLADVAARIQALQTRPGAQRILQLARAWMGTTEVDISQLLRDAASAVSRFLMDAGPSLLRNVGEWFVSFFLIFITMFFLLRDGPQVIEAIKAASPLPHEIEEELFRKFEDVSYATFFGSLLTAVAQGLAACLLFWALSLPAPLFWGAVVSLVSLVPIVGTFLVWLPWTAYLLLAGQTTRGILLMAIGGLVVGSIDNFLKPIIIRGRTDMHPLLVFLSVLGGLQAFGFLGVLLGPLLVALFLTFLNFYQLEFRETLLHKRSSSALWPQNGEEKQMPDAVAPAPESHPSA